MPAGFVFGVAGLSRPAIAALEATAAMITAARRVSLIFSEGLFYFWSFVVVGPSYQAFMECELHGSG